MEKTTWHFGAGRVCVCWGGEAAAEGERQGPATGPVLGAARFIPIAHSSDFSYNPNRSDKT